MKFHSHVLTTLSILVGAGCVTAPPMSAQSPVPVTTASIPANQLEELVAPIALYPDALVAILLPASTASSDVVLAARFLSANNPVDQIDAQPWDDSVKALAHYPDVVKWMDENLAWTQQLGAAYTEQPSEVMAAIQRDRQRARANGILVDTPQQRVVVEDGGYIRIVPAQADVIYVPRYEPEIVYVEQPVYYGPDPWITFGVGFGVGWWLSYDCDWRTRVIWVDRDRHHHWNDHRRDWRYPEFPHGGVAHHDSRWQPWRPAPGRPRPIYRPGDWAAHRDHWQPRPIAGAPRVNIDRDRNHPPSSGFAGRPGPSIERDWSRDPGRNSNSPRRQTVQPPPRSTVGTAPVASNQLGSNPQLNEPSGAPGNNRRWNDRRREPGVTRGEPRSPVPGQNNVVPPAAQPATPAATAMTPTIRPPSHRPSPMPPRERDRQSPPGQTQNVPRVIPAAPSAPAPAVPSRPVAVQAPGAGRGWTPPAHTPAAAPSSPPRAATVQPAPAAQSSRVPQATRSEPRASRGDSRRQQN